MTLYHFANCLALAYTPYYLTYKYMGLSEYGAFWKVGQASLMYILTQLAKMLFLATFFPMSELEEEEVHLTPYLAHHLTSSPQPPPHLTSLLTSLLT